MPAVNTFLLMSSARLFRGMMVGRFDALIVRKVSPLRSCSSFVHYPIQLASVSEDHAALYEESLKHPEQFWGDLARRRLRWVKDFDQVMDCDMKMGSINWFNGGILNVSG